MNTLTLKLKEFFATEQLSKEDIRIPINKLCGLEVTCNLRFSKSHHTNNYGVQLYIESTKICNLDNNNNNSYLMLYATTLWWSHKQPLDDDYKIIQEKLSETMKKIKFNKYTGSYETESSYETEKNGLTGDDWCSILGFEVHIEYEFDICCICHMSTKSITSNCCKKQLCYECWDKLPMARCQECPENPRGDCEYIRSCGTAKCPLCRCSLASGKEFEY